MNISLTCYIKTGAEYLKETLEEIGNQQGILQLDYEIQARISNVQHDVTSLASKTFKWAKKRVKKTASYADGYLFTSRKYVLLYLFYYLSLSLSFYVFCFFYFYVFTFFCISFFVCLKVFISSVSYVYLCLDVFRA